MKNFLYDKIFSVAELFVVVGAICLVAIESVFSNVPWQK